MATSPEHRQRMLDHMSTVADIVAKFQKARGNRAPYTAQGECPVCKKNGDKGTVHFRFTGPRAARMWCDGPNCGVRVMS